MRNNKKLIILLGGVIIILTAAFYYLRLSKPPVQVENLADLAPSGGLIYVAADDLKSSWDKIKGTDVYSGLAQLLMFKDNDTFGKIKEQANWLSEKDLMDVLGKEVFLSVYSEDTKFERPDVDIVLLSRIDNSVALKESLAKINSKIQKDKLITRNKYKGFDVSIVKHEGLRHEFAYSIIGDVLIISNARGRLEKAIDLIGADSEGSISSDPGFLRVKSRFSGSWRAWLYYDVSKFYQLAKNLSQDMKAIYKAQEKLTPFKNYFLTVDFNEGIYLKGWAYLDLESIEDPEIKTIWEGINDANLEALKFIPLDVALFSGGNYGQAKSLFAYFKKSMSGVINGAVLNKAASNEKINAQEYSPDKIIEQLNSFLGFDLENDFLPFLGKDYGFTLAGFKAISIPLALEQGRAGPINLNFPELFVYADTKDKDKIDVLLSGLWQRIADLANAQAKLQAGGQAKPREQKLPAVQEGAGPDTEEQKVPDMLIYTVDDYSGISIHGLKMQNTGTLPAMFSDDVLSPSYCFLGNYLIVGTNQPLLRKIINVYNKKLLSLVDSVKFSQIRTKLHPEFNGLFYINPKQYIEPMIAIFSSMNNSLANNLKEKEIRKNMRNAVDVLNVLKDVNVMGASSMYEDGFFEFDFFTPVEGL
ncbi:MAG: hypothetical protein COV72_05890 [Candidatus Omnitrophica bacterium CG11_big_fil_rev_8_21_14_0_20_42_13]|uniref:DUF3352 domain-containing protein n=1 Tax=Candidatus Ghiorseimicrobium undicola TaxID=1974746 RepID=A0A2H0LWL2_9BACT|nr:MAG: hypothetical protein COV72_05890 [Candidatus Omnitrophica bacterium CG11_big_fil_rev_8_21_14_0_20_42_13]